MKSAASVSISDSAGEAASAIGIFSLIPDFIKTISVKDTGCFFGQCYEQIMEIGKSLSKAEKLLPASPWVMETEYAKIPRHTSQNSIAAGNLE